MINTTSYSQHAWLTSWLMAHLTSIYNLTLNSNFFFPSWKVTILTFNIDSKCKIKNHYKIHNIWILRNAFWRTKAKFEYLKITRRDITSTSTWFCLNRNKYSSSYVKDTKSMSRCSNKSIIFSMWICFFTTIDGNVKGETSV